MHAPFGDDFAVKMREFFQEPDILQQEVAGRIAIINFNEGEVVARGASSR